MDREEYIYRKLESLSPLNKALSQEMAASLGEWATIEEVAKYLKRHKNTIYDKVDGGDVLYRRIGPSILIYTRSLIFFLE
ncbi:helix-turn-helix domain-containing protein [Fusobacterium sp.]|uniref:helix-turn-helix domain-containing protein n=1 Tax=Fusobacterium sp. TaxID=68766 RepID=UPI002903DFE3|nr:helix-turn-helix domain-containing protein [Fusobacterium sp.]MDU1911989.1 helix-turn-helix domain-containing protein [Fusobacterium sp.]